MGCTAIVSLAGVSCSPVFSGNFSRGMHCLFLVSSGFIILPGYTNLSFFTFTPPLLLVFDLVDFS